MLRQRFFCLILVLSLLVSLAACSDEPRESSEQTRVLQTSQTTQKTEPTKPVPSVDPDVIAKAVVKELTSRPYAGRLAGTAGNDKASGYIAAFFMANAFSSVFGDGYFQEYAHAVLNPDIQKTRIVLTNQDGSRTELVAGKDFITSASASNLSRTSTLDFQASGASRSIPVITNPAADASSFNSSVVIRASDTLNLMPHDFAFGQPFQIHLTSLLKNSLQKNGAQRVQVTTQGYQPEKVLRNVVAVLKGSGNSKKAIVLTAHYDHYGSQGNLLFPGAHDNASGVATLLSIADRIKNLPSLKTITQSVDIVFAAVNSGIYQYGTTTFPGSKALESALRKQYDVLYQINIDAVGSPTAGPLTMGALSQESEKLTNALRAAFDKKGIAFNDRKPAPSDHYWFVSNHTAAATIGQDTSSVKASILTDVAEKLDYVALAILSEAVSEFIVTQGASLIEQIIPDAEESIRRRQEASAIPVGDPDEEICTFDLN